MSFIIPVISTGTAPVTLVPGKAYRQMLVENIDTTNSLTVAWNGSGGSWLLLPQKAIGIGLMGGVTTITLTPVAGTPQYQVLLQG